MKKVGIAILGLGVVGGGTYQLLQSHRDFYRATQGVDLSVEAVLEIDREKALSFGVPAEKLRSNIAEVVADPDVGIIVETVGGVSAAREFVLAALNAGKTVVTSNKELLCKYSGELERIAKRQNAGLFFEATCAGGVPVVRSILDSLQANKISSVVGILNGTTNYILTEMSEKGTSYEEALKDAQKLGYAESDPSADVEGYDAAYKLSILCSLAFHASVPFSRVHREGISSLSKEDIALGKSLHYTLKLVAVGKQTDAGIEVRVHPAFVREGHPLSSVNGSENAVTICGDAVGEVTLRGKGAGDLPTGSAVVSDILYAATHSDIRCPALTGKDKEGASFTEDFEGAYYFRLTVRNASGMLAKIASVLGKAGVSVSEVVQCDSEEESATAVIITHETHETAIKNAVSKLEPVCRVESVLRVIG